MQYLSHLGPTLSTLLWCLARQGPSVTNLTPCHVPFCFWTSLARWTRGARWPRPVPASSVRQRPTAAQRTILDHDLPITCIVPRNLTFAADMATSKTRHHQYPMHDFARFTSSIFTTHHRLSHVSSSH
ncbi:hypothetical protein IWZ03DRAFT_384304 [Phyllosticta citriasiana]|uniref:Secreted protein n=1 Tax=Phyllosticta citriasiana TaxID=595635 RepID=A0ABR1KFQ0_9PEZI